MFNFLRSGADRAQLLRMAPSRPRPSASSGNNVGLRGRLEQFGLATVLTFLDLERRSGQILVDDGERVGRVWLRAGRVISARIEGSRRVNRAAISSSWYGTGGTSTSRRLICRPPSTRSAHRRRCSSSRPPAAPTKPQPTSGSARSVHLRGGRGVELLVLRSKLGTPAAANDQSGRLSFGRGAPRPPSAPCVAPRLRSAGTPIGSDHIERRKNVRLDPRSTTDFPRAFSSANRRAAFTFFRHSERRRSFKGASGGALFHFGFFVRCGRSRSGRQSSRSAEVRTPRRRHVRRRPRRVRHTTRAEVGGARRVQARLRAVGRRVAALPPGRDSHALGDDVAAVRFYRSYIGDAIPGASNGRPPTGRFGSSEMKAAKPSPRLAPAALARRRPRPSPRRRPRRRRHSSSGKNPPRRSPPSTSAPRPRPRRGPPDRRCRAGCHGSASARRWRWAQGLVMTGLGASQRYDELRGSAVRPPKGARRRTSIR